MPRNERWLWPIAFLAFTLCGAFLLNGGYAHYEGQFFLVNYLDARGLFPKIFSAHFNEWDCYQGRELSFFFGWLDAEFIRYSARLGWVHLYSITHFVGLFALAVTLSRALPRLFPKLEQRDAGLIVALLLTAPTALFSGYYYRPAKILAAFFLAVVLLCIGRLRERNWDWSNTTIVLLCIASTLMGLSDRLGIYMILLSMIAVVIARPLDRASIAILAAMLGALLINGVWSVGIGPKVSAAADGYAPNTVDQLVHPRFTYLHADHYTPALSLLRDHIEYFFGNFGIVSVIAVVCIGFALIFHKPDKRTLLAVGAATLATVAVYVAMYARLTSLPWPASRRVYYWLPQLVVFAIGAALVAARSKLIFPKASNAVAAILMLMIAGNLISIPSHMKAIRSQEHRPWIEQSAALRECVRDDTRAATSFGLDAPYAQICGRLRAAVAGIEWDGTPAAQPNPRLYCPRVRS